MQKWNYVHESHDDFLFDSNYSIYQRTSVEINSLNSAFSRQRWHYQRKAIKKQRIHSSQRYLRSINLKALLVSSDCFLTFHAPDFTPSVRGQDKHCWGNYSSWLSDFYRMLRLISVNIRFTAWLGKTDRVRSPFLLKGGMVTSVFILRGSQLPYWHLFPIYLHPACLLLGTHELHTCLWHKEQKQEPSNNPGGSEFPFLVDSH